MGYHEYDLSWGPLAEISVENSTSPLSQNSIFICGADFFQILIKSTIFGNKNNFCCFFKQHDPQSVADLSGVAGDPLIVSGTVQTEKNYVFGGSAVENGSPSTIWGVKCCQNFYLFKQQQKMPTFCKRNIFLSLLLKKLSATDNFYYSRTNFLKMDFELHTCYHEYDLSDITNWQHIGGGPLAEISVDISASPLSQNSIFICGADFFQVLINSTIFGNKNNFYCF